VPEHTDRHRQTQTDTDTDRQTDSPSAVAPAHTGVAMDVPEQGNRLQPGDDALMADTIQCPGQTMSGFKR
jgi:hypothetical protein